MYSEFSRHSKNPTVLDNQRKKVEKRGMKGVTSLKRNLIPNEKTLLSIISKTRKMEIKQRTLSSFLITEITIRRISQQFRFQQLQMQNKNLEGRK